MYKCLYKCQGEFTYPATGTGKRGLVVGTWGGVPVGCSVQFANEPNHDYVSSNQDQSPHWNDAARSDNSRLTNGGFRLMCRVKYNLAPLAVSLPPSRTLSPPSSAAPAASTARFPHRFSRLADVLHTVWSKQVNQRGWGNPACR